MVRTVDLVFHYGKYQCLGKTVALMEFNKIFVEVRMPVCCLPAFCARCC